MIYDYLDKLIDGDVLIGFSTFANRDVVHCLPLAKEVKARYDCPVLLGGYAASTCAELVATEYSEFFDGICVSAGEAALVAALERMDGPKLRDRHEIPNLVYFEDGEVKQGTGERLLGKLKGKTFRQLSNPSLLGDTTRGTEEEVEGSAKIMSLVDAGKPIFRNKKDLEEKIKYPNKGFASNIKEGRYSAIEDKNFLKVLKQEGYDSFTTSEKGGKNVMLFEPEKQFVPLFDEKKTSTLGYKKGGSVVERNPYNYTAKAI